MYSDGATAFHTLSAASTNATSVVARRCTLEALILINTTATVYYLKFYDKASAPTVGTDPVYFTVPVPAATGAAGVVVPFPRGVLFKLGLAFGITGALADADATNAAAGVAVDLFAR